MSVGQRSGNEAAADSVAGAFHLLPVWMAPAGLMLLLLVVLAQTFFPFVRCPSLSGAVVESAKPRFTMRAWFSGDFQKRFDKWFGAHVGFRSFWVLTENQINFSVFREISAKFDRPGTRVVLGRENWLYEEGYIHELVRPGWGTPQQVTDTARKLSRLQAELRSRGIGFAVVVAPSKAEIYPEYIPECYLRRSRLPGEQTNYEKTMPVFRELGVPCVDAHALFQQWKPLSPYPLFARGGVHWNYYGASRIAEELVRTLQPAVKKPIPQPVVREVVLRPPSGTDRDLADLINVWSRRATDAPTPYPVFGAPAGESGFKPSILMVGDSFSWTLIDVLMDAGVCGEVDLLYYYKRQAHFPGNVSQAFDSATADWNQLLGKKDAVVIVLSEIGGLPNLGKPFVGDALVALRRMAAAETTGVSGGESR